MAKPLSHAEKIAREKYQRRAAKVAPYHKFSFNAAKLAKSGKLTPPQKAAISRKEKETRGIRKQIRQKRVVFVPVKSDYRKRRAVATGSVVDKTTRGVFVSVNQGQIERSGIGRLRVDIGRGGSVNIRYGKTRVENVAINPVDFARNPAKIIQQEFAKRRARAVSVVINGWEARGRTQGGELVQTQAWEQYTNDLLARIAADMLKADRRRSKESVRREMSETVSLRFYYGRGVETQPLGEFMEQYQEYAEEGEDFETDLSDE